MWRINKALGINKYTVNISFAEALPTLTARPWFPMNSFGGNMRVKRVRV